MDDIFIPLRWTDTYHAHHVLHFPQLSTGMTEYTSQMYTQATFIVYPMTEYIVYTVIFEGRKLLSAKF